MNIPKIKDAKVINSHTLIITFTNEKKKLYSIKSLLKREPFAVLKNEAYFKNFNIETGGYAICWDKNVDISEYELWKNGEDLA